MFELVSVWHVQSGSRHGLHSAGAMNVAIVAWFNIAEIYCNML
jgi:hypothetical protein